MDNPELDVAIDPDLEAAMLINKIAREQVCRGLGCRKRVCITLGNAVDYLLTHSGVDGSYNPTPGGITERYLEGE